jgi:uncharacterized RDD family membrane protein YckC
MSEHNPGVGGGWAPPSAAAPAFGERTWRPDPAGWGSRVGASLLDGIIVGVVMLVVTVVVGVGDGDGGGSAFSDGFTVLWVLGTVVYAPLMLAFNRGQTLGKAAVGIRVVNSDTAPIGLARAFLRELPVKWVCGIIPLIDVLWPLWQRENKALHDLLAKTWVVEAN